MSLPGHFTRGRVGRDPVARAAVWTGLTAAILAVGQLLLAQWTGGLAWRDGTTGAVHESSFVIWLAAVSAGLGAAVGRRCLGDREATVKALLCIAGMAAVGALLAAPVASAIAAWSHMYGGDLSQIRALRLVLCGVLLGACCAYVTSRSAVASASLMVWMLLIWLLVPPLGSLWWGTNSTVFAAVWPEATSMLSPGTGLLIVFAVCGSAATAVAYLRRRRPVPSRVRQSVEATAGPLLAFAAYGFAGAFVWHWSMFHAAGLALAALAAGIAFDVTLRTAHHWWTMRT